jgi:hypothetical protein
MFPDPDLSDLRNNGPIVFMPNLQALSSPFPPPPGDDQSACEGTPSTSPLPTGEGIEAPALSNPLNPEPQTLNPSLRGRRRVLDENKQAAVCNLVAAGVSLRQVAQFVDCDRKSIRREAQRNGAFRRQLAKARSEASIHPLQTLRQAAKADWRAALCWMERLDPQRFARPDASVVTQRESNQFVGNLVEAIEETVSNPRQRGDLFDLLSAVMPAAMRRRWEGRRLRGKIQQTKIAEERRQGLERQLRNGRRLELFREIGQHLPFELRNKLLDNVDLLDPEEVFAPGPPASAERASAGAEPHNDAATKANSTTDDRSSDDPTSDDPTSAGQTNNAPPGDNFVPPPGRNSDNFAPPPHANREPANDLRAPRGAKFTE